MHTDEQKDLQNLNQRPAEFDGLWPSRVMALFVRVNPH
jgi:hypothetical protein